MAGVVPRDWRRAVFVPIHKQGSRKLRLFCYLVLMKLNLKLRKQIKPLESTKWKLRLNKLMEKGVRVKSQRELGTRFTQVVVMWQLNGCKESIAGVVP